MSSQVGFVKRTTTLRQTMDQEQWQGEERSERSKRNTAVISSIHGGSVKPSYAQSAVLREDHFATNKPKFNHAPREKSFMSLNFEVNRVAKTFVSQPNSMDLPSCMPLSAASPFSKTSKENMPIAEDGSFGAVTMRAMRTTKNAAGIDISPSNSIISTSSAKTLKSLENEIEAIPSEETELCQNLVIGDAVCLNSVQLDNLASKEIHYDADKVNLFDILEHKPSPRVDVSLLGLYKSLPCGNLGFGYALGSSLEHFEGVAML